MNLGRRRHDQAAQENARLAAATRSPGGAFSASALAVGLVFLLASPGLVAATDAGVADDVGAPAPSGESADAGADPDGTLPGGVQPPRLVAPVKATYPEAAAAAGREAVVPLVLTVGIDGAVTAVEVESPVGHGFDEAATAAAWQYRRAPPDPAERSPGRAGRIPRDHARSQAVARGRARAHPVARAKRPGSYRTPPQPATVELFDPPPPAPPPPPPAEPEPPPPPRPRSPPKAAPAPTPAQAAEVMAKEPIPEVPLDLTAFSLPTGQAASYAGGKTAASGTSTRAVTGAVSHEGVADGTGDDPAGGLSAPVSLRGDEWDCPWPAEAEALGIDQETVVIEVTAAADGRVDSARLIRDPGHGFGPATLACARQTRFEPARDRGGRAVPARSGPIRVRFWR